VPALLAGSGSSYALCAADADQARDIARRIRETLHMASHVATTT
jgi:hypothetical protein